MKILVTGGAGFVGSHLCERLARSGHTVLCLDNFLSGNLTNVRHLLDLRTFKLIKGDVRDTQMVAGLARDCEVVFHLAAQVHVDRSYVEPELTYDINVKGTQNILEAARLFGVRRVVLASTSEVYGSAVYAPIDEQHPLNAPHPYGASKIAADRMAYAYQHTYGMDVVIARPFNLYGPRQRDAGYGGVISIFTRRALSGQPPIIFGDGAQTRDYTHVSDVVAAYEAILNHEAPIREPINFGCGREVSILDLARMILARCDAGAQLAPVMTEARIGEVRRLIANSKRAQELLGWIPQVSLEKGLDGYVSWYRQYGFEERLRLG